MNQQQQQQEQTSSGLTRYKSAPSSYFTSLFTSDDGFGGDFENIFNTRAPSPETNRVFASFMDSVDTVDQNCSSNMSIQSQSQPQFVQSVKHETVDQQLQRHGSNDFSSASHMMYQSQPQQGYNSEAATSAIDDSYGRSSSSINSDRVNQMKFNGGSTNLIRHSSSPAGFFSNINIENEFDVMRGVGDFGAGISTNAEAPTFSFKSPINFSSGHPSSSETMNPIDEMRRKTSPGKRHLEEDGNKNGGYITSFPAITPWDDDNKIFSNVSNNQNTDDQIRGTIPLSHHLSLPKNSSLLSDMSFQDSVPCKIRAKRGFATHPRSIAERVRRTRISERIRKLQELVPNMDKQTSTSEMLDLAVDYIKDLQMQLKKLSDNRAKCTCST